MEGVGQVEPHVYSVDDAVKASADEVLELHREFVNEAFVDLLARAGNVVKLAASTARLLQKAPA